MKRLLFGLILAPIAFATTAAADRVWLSLAADPAGTECDVADPGPGGEVSVYVILHIDGGDVTGMWFAAPLPPNTGLTHLYDSSSYSFVGSSQSEIAVGLNSCQYGQNGPSLAVLEMHFLRTAGGSCTFYRLAQAPSYGSHYSDCHFYDRLIPLRDGVVLNSDGSCSHIVPPSHPIPSDGETGVPLLVDLSWDHATPVCQAVLCSGEPDSLFLGTTPGPPGVGKFDSPHRVGPLLPATTYYWRVDSNCVDSTGPVWSFTTTNNVATQPTTWGRIKALYR